MRMIMGAIVLVLGLTACGGNSEKESAAEPMSEWEKQQAAASEGESKWGDGTGAMQTPDPVLAPEPTLDDFGLTLKTKERKCFGSAGCNLTVEISPGISDLALMEGRTVELTYELRGVEDGPVIGTIDISEDGSHQVEEQLVQTTSANAKLKAVPTDLTIR